MGVFFTVSIAHQAYLLTWEYEEYDMMSSSQEMLRKHTLAYAVPILIVSAVINLPRWFSYKLEKIGNVYKMVETDMEKNCHYKIYYENFVLNVLTVFVPITLLVFFNWSVFNFIKKKQHEIDGSAGEIHLQIPHYHSQHADILGVIPNTFNALYWHQNCSS